MLTSRRTYGNELTGAKDAVKQLWVAAIDQTPQPGVDPSHTSYSSFMDLKDPDGNTWLIQEVGYAAAGS